MNYDPAIFTHVTTLQSAKRIILTDESTLKTDERWERETPHICDLIYKHIKLTEESVVLDYGCGVGRLAKELIERHGCWVIGADISPNMLALAESYVASAKFIACNPKALQFFGFKVDAVLAVWVLQHVEDLTSELFRIQDSMKAGGKCFVVNEASSRFIPTNQGWINDGKDVGVELRCRFRRIGNGNLNPEVVGDEQSQRTFWAVYKK